MIEGFPSQGGTGLWIEEVDDLTNGEACCELAGSPSVPPPPSPPPPVCQDIQCNSIERVRIPENLATSPASDETCCRDALTCAAVSCTSPFTNLPSPDAIMIEGFPSQGGTGLWIEEVDDLTNGEACCELAGSPSVPPPPSPPPPVCQDIQCNSIDRVRIPENLDTSPASDETCCRDVLTCAAVSCTSPFTHLTSPDAILIEGLPSQGGTGLQIQEVDDLNNGEACCKIAGSPSVPPPPSPPQPVCQDIQCNSIDRVRIPENLATSPASDETCCRDALTCAAVSCTSPFTYLPYQYAALIEGLPGQGDIGLFSYEVDLLANGDLCCVE